MHRSVYSPVVGALGPGLALLFLSGAVCTPTWAGDLISQELAQRNGMHRAWFSQVQLNPARNEIESCVLGGDTIVAVTTAGIVHAMDAETGATRWTTRVGNPDYPSLGPAISDTHIALVNGSTLYVLDRQTGGQLLSRRLGGAPAGGPSLSPSHAFVPLISGRVEGYALNRQAQTPWYYTSAGRIFQPTVADAGSVVWSTDQSKLFVAGANADGVRFRFDTGAPIVAPATVRSPLVFAASVAGYVYALNENSGQQRWRYAAGFRVEHSPVVIGDTVFVATDEPALHAIEAETGLAKWVAGGVTQFVAASSSRVGAIDEIGGLVALDRESGVVQARAATRGINRAVLNDQTDRLYLYSRSGLIQCFHEIGADEPLFHQAPPEEPADKEAGKPQPKDAGQPEIDGAADDPFADAPEREAEAPLTDDPFDGASDDPGNDPFSGDSPEDPFGSGAGDSSGDDPFGDPFGG